MRIYVLLLILCIRSLEKFGQHYLNSFKKTKNIYFKLLVRSQSMGPAVLDSNESPKRQLRVSSTAPAPANVSSSNKIIKKPPGSAVLATPHPAPDRKPRPCKYSHKSIKLLTFAL